MKNSILCSSLISNNFFPLTNEILFNAFAGGKSQTFRDSNGFIEVGIIQKIQREDGSGHSWNVTVVDSTNQSFTFHIRTTK